MKDKIYVLTHKQADRPSFYGRIRYGGLIGLVVYCESPKGRNYIEKAW